MCFDMDVVQLKGMQRQVSSGSHSWSAAVSAAGAYKYPVNMLFTSTIAHDSNASDPALHPRRCPSAML